MKDLSENIGAAMQQAATDLMAGMPQKNKRSRLLPASAPVRSQPAALAPVQAAEPIEPEPAEEYEDENDVLKERFQVALVGHCKAESSLSSIVAEMIGEDIDRDTAIEWGIEAGLSESYVQSTVSRLYIALTGERKKKVGGGRKQNKGASGFAERALKACDDDISKAKALLLAARRLIETWESNGTVEKELAKIRTAKSE